MTALCVVVVCSLIALVSHGCALTALCVSFPGQFDELDRKMREEGVAPPHTRYTHVPSEDTLAYLQGKDLVYSLNNFVTLQVMTSNSRSVLTCCCCAVRSLAFVRATRVFVIVSR